MNIFKALPVIPMLFQLSALTAAHAQDNRSTTTQAIAAHAFQDDSCKPELLTTPTAFPKKSQQAGEYGLVKISVVVGGDGKAVKTSVARSSGYAALDSAAQYSVQTDWRFDVKNCTAADLARSHSVDVIFKRASRLPYTFSSTLKPITVTANRELADSHCAVTRDANGMAITACIDKDAGARHTELAEREIAKR